MFLTQVVLDVLTAGGRHFRPAGSDLLLNAGFPLLLGTSRKRLQ